MKAERLVEMANDIGNFFKVEPDHEEAVSGVYNHMRKFWEPRMQRQIVVYYNKNSGDKLQPVVREAVEKLKKEVEASA